MLICNLAVLLAQRQLKITRVSNDTGISRTTLTALNQNESKGVQFETMNTLCQYLSINPDDFFEYLPFDVETAVSTDKETIIDGLDSYNKNGLMTFATIYPFDLDLYISKKSLSESTGMAKKTFDLVIRLNHAIELSEELPNIFKLKVLLGSATNNSSYFEQKKEFEQFWNYELTPASQQIIKKQIMQQCHDTFKEIIVDLLKSNYDAKFRSLQFSFTFDNAYTEADLSTPKIELRSEDPF